MKLICAFCVLLLLISFKSDAQYSFEKFPALKYVKLKVKIGLTKADTTSIANADYKKYKITVSQKKNSPVTQISVKYKNRIVSIFQTEDVIPTTLQDTIYAADIDGNGHIDFKLIFFNNGSGLAGSLEYKLYFFNNGNSGFKKIFYADFFNFTERDLDGDGKFEIIGNVLTRYQAHSYWTFNLFNYDNGRLVNVNNKFHYPIMVQYLDRDNYEITRRISRKKMKIFSLKEPDYFKSRGVTN